MEGRDQEENDGADQTWARRLGEDSASKKLSAVPIEPFLRLDMLLRAGLEDRAAVQGHDQAGVVAVRPGHRRDERSLHLKNRHYPIERKEES